MFYANSRMKLACCVPCEVEFIIGTNIGLLKVEKLSKLIIKVVFNCIEIMVNLDEWVG